ncbi:transposase [Conexibacter sp. SYSU D00693]|uniref:transposase n=1 Tax=Conexibacter sp. SYSU D00693 TaxID=2812560 RepID=UPI00196AADEC|nr:transposase [Conexibacter sp. SYSU D00693]
MPRAPRPLAADLTYHVTAQAIPGAKLIVDPRDAELYLALLARTVFQRGWLCLAYCLMLDHIHLLVTTPAPDLHDGMRDLHGRFVSRRHKTRGAWGALFARRYDAKVVQDQNHLLEALRYIPLNPVRGGLCLAPAAWPWSSHRAMAGVEPAPAFLALDQAVRHIAAWDGRAAPAAYFDLLRRADRLSDRSRELLEHEAQAAPAGRSPIAAPKPEWDAAEFLGRTPTDELVHAAHRLYGHSLEDIGAHLGQHRTTIARRIARCDGV